MLNRIGIAGLIGMAFMAIGIVLVGMIEPIIALGLALVVAGVGLLTYGMISQFMQTFAMMGAPPEPPQPPES